MWREKHEMSRVFSRMLVSIRQFWPLGDHREQSLPAQTPTLLFKCFLSASDLRLLDQLKFYPGFPMLIRLTTAMCAATLLTACGQVDYGLHHSNHTIHQDQVHCRGDKYPTGFHSAHVDRATLEVLKTKCDLQYGEGSFPIEVVISHDPNIQPFEYRDDTNTQTGKPQHQIYGVFCPTTWNYDVAIYDYPIGGNTRTIGECKTRKLGTRAVTNSH